MGMEAAAALSVYASVLKAQGVVNQQWPVMSTEIVAGTLQPADKDGLSVGHIEVVYPPVGRLLMLLVVVSPDGTINGVDADMAATDLALPYAQFSQQYLMPAMAQISHAAGKS